MTVFTSTSNVKGISPEAIADLITLPVEAASIAVQASTLIPTDATRTHIPLVTGDPSASWVAEGAEIGASDPTIDDIVAVPAKIAGLTIITNELAADTSPAAAGIVGDGLARDIAKKIDLAFFGSKGASTIQPSGLEDLLGSTFVTQAAAWTNFDPFEEAIANAEKLGLTIGSWVAHPDDSLAIAKLKETTTSNRGLLQPDPSSPTKKQISGIRFMASPGVRPGTIWGIPRERSIIVRRNDVDLQSDKSAYFTSDRTAIRATLRVTFAFPHAAAIQRIMLGSTAVATITAATPASAVAGAEVTLTGTNFIGTRAVKLGAVAVSSYTVVSATSMKVIVPVGSAGSAPVTVTNNFGDSSAFAYTRG